MKKSRLEAFSDDVAMNYAASGIAKFKPEEYFSDFEKITLKQEEVSNKRDALQEEAGIHSYVAFLKDEVGVSYDTQIAAIVGTDAYWRNEIRAQQENRELTKKINTLYWHVSDQFLKVRLLEVQMKFFHLHLMGSRLCLHMGQYLYRRKEKRSVKIFISLVSTILSIAVGNLLFGTLGAAIGAAIIPILGKKFEALSKKSFAQASSFLECAHGRFDAFEREFKISSALFSAASLNIDAKDLVF